MDPLSALGIAAAVVQFVDFGQRLFSETWHVYRSAAGADVKLRELSTVIHDLDHIVETVRKVLGPDSSEHTDTMLLRVCAQCDAIAKEVENILTQIDKSFQEQFTQVEGSSKKYFKGEKGAGSRKIERKLSAGEAFRRALRTLGKGKELYELKSRLNDIRQQIMMATTMSIWWTSRGNRGWETEFSEKLDTMIETLQQAVENTVDLGPGRHSDERKDGGCASPHDPQVRRGEGIGPIEPIALASLDKGPVAEGIISQLWHKDWQPEASILSTFPQRSSLSPRELKSAIGESLSFDSINNREEAISKTFKTTYDWVFSRTPTLSDTGEPLWSSLPGWLESSSQLPYWITGKPGAGKSTAMKYIATHPEMDRYLSRWARGFPVYKIKYYAWKPGLDLAKSEEGLLRTLLHQALRTNPDLTPVVCPRRWALFHMVRELNHIYLPPWSDWELRESFSRLLHFAEGAMRLVIFVDGLDEFDVAPVQLCSLIQSIAQHDAIKICVASRSWPQFSDAFSESPGMHMHLLTRDDIKAYVFDSFKGVRAFLELNSLYQNGGDKLLDQLVSKSDGVFLWTAIVTQTIYQSLVEGASLSQLQSILDRMPPELESLYDAIYSTIPERLLPESSAMLQIHVSACAPVKWMTLWLADETRGHQMRVDVQALDYDQLQTTLERRLSARTRGILNVVNSTQTVEFLHRTAAEWVKQPRVWEQLILTSPTGFDPHMCLLRAGNIIMESWGAISVPDIEEKWKKVTETLLYASLVNCDAVSQGMLVAAVEHLHHAANNCLSPYYPSRGNNENWPMYQPTSDKNKRRLLGSLGEVSLLPHNSFHGLAVQFAILPYVRWKFEEHPARFHPVPTKGSRALLEQAIFGPQRYSPDSDLSGIDTDRIPQAQRLETIAYLLSKGIRQAGIASSFHGAEMSRNRLYKERNGSYYADVNHLLQYNNALGNGRRTYMKERFNTQRRKWFG